MDWRLERRPGWHQARPGLPAPCSGADERQTALSDHPRGAKAPLPATNLTWTPTD